MKTLAIIVLLLCTAGCAVGMPGPNTRPEISFRPHKIKVTGFEYKKEEKVGSSVGVAVGNNAAFGTSYGSAFSDFYQVVNTEELQKRFALQLEKDRIADFIVSDGPADYAITGIDVQLNGGYTRAMSWVTILGPECLGILTLFGAPYPKWASGQIVARIYDKEGKFIEEFEEKATFYYGTTIYTAHIAKQKRGDYLSETLLTRIYNRLIGKIQDLERSNLRKSSIQK